MSISLRCPECGQPTEVISTRIYRGGGTLSVRRRRVCPAGHRNTSLEDWASRDLRRAIVLGPVTGTKV